MKNAEKGFRRVTVRLEVDYDLEIPNIMKMDEVKDLLVQYFMDEHQIESTGITVHDRSDDRLIRTRKFK